MNPMYVTSSSSMKNSGIDLPFHKEELAMAYVPKQKFLNVYEPDKALKIGTIFPELNKPFLGRRGRN